MEDDFLDCDVPECRLDKTAYPQPYPEENNSFLGDHQFFILFSWLFNYQNMLSSTLQYNK